MSGARVNPTTEPCLDCGATGLMRQARGLCMACYARRKRSGLPMPEKTRQGTKAATCPNCGATAGCTSFNNTTRGVRRVHVCPACGHRHVRFDGVPEELVPPQPRKRRASQERPSTVPPSRRKKPSSPPAPPPRDPERPTLRDRLAARRAAELGLTLAEHRMLIGVDR